jgi:hypothetical protein
VNRDEAGKPPVLDEGRENIEYLKGVEAVQYWGLLEAVGAFNKAKIPVMLLKGAVDLAAPKYGPPEHRPRAMGDIDILVRGEDWERAEARLLRLGYRYLDSERESGLTFAALGQSAYVRDNPPIRVDLHHQLHKHERNEGFIDLEGVWKRAKAVTFEGKRALVPSLQDDLWYRFVHFFYLHECPIDEMTGGGGRLRQLVDLFHHHRKSVDWDMMLEKANRFDMSKSLSFLIYCCSRRHGEAPPDSLSPGSIAFARAAWRWAAWAGNISTLFTYAAGRFTILTLMRGYNFFQTARYYYGEIFNLSPDNEILAKYRLKRLPRLAGLAKLLHFGRMVSLHLLMRGFYLYFLCTGKGRCGHQPQGG